MKSTINNKKGGKIDYAVKKEVEWTPHVQPEDACASYDRKHQTL